MLVCVVGNFGNGNQLTDGQRIKTNELYNSLINQYGSKEVCKVNLNCRNMLLLGGKLLWGLMKSRNVIVLVSRNGRKKVIPFLVILNKLLNKRIFHSLIGSTTHQTLQESPKLISYYNSLAGNWSETETEKRLLEGLGLRNVAIVNNFKNLNILKVNELVYSFEEPLAFCTFSRVEERKGIPNVVSAINTVNRMYGRNICTLDIYGEVEETYKNDFNKLMSDFGNSIRYKGVVKFSESVEALKSYYMLIFPTKYFTEGIPGTLIDSMAAGVPIICSEYESCFDIMKPTIGVTYKFDNDKSLIDAIIYSISNVKSINQKKISCLKEAEKYSSGDVIKKICDYIERRA